MLWVLRGCRAEKLPKFLVANEIRRVLVGISLNPDKLACSGRGERIFLGPSGEKWCRMGENAGYVTDRYLPASLG